MNKHNATFEQWKTEVEKLMKNRYGLEPSDYDSPPNATLSPYDGGDTAEEFVEMYGDKYGLDRIDLKQF